MEKTREKMMSRRNRLNLLLHNSHHNVPDVKKVGKSGLIGAAQQIMHGLAARQDQQRLSPRAVV